MPQTEHRAGPSEALVAFVRDHLPEADRFVERTVPHGEARVWSVGRGDQVVAYLKRHRHAAKAVQEHHAYTHWLPAIGWGTAEYLGRCEDRPRALLTRAAAGVPLLEARLSSDERLAVYREVGRFLAALHALDVLDEDPMPVGEALVRRAEGWCDRAQSLVDHELLDGVLELMAGPWPVELRRVPCHRDLHTSNVLVASTEAGLGITVIDFGQARLDVWISDLVKLFQDPELVAAGVGRAFFDGYGRRMTALEGRLLTGMRALHGLATWVWADEHGDDRGVHVGREVLEAALEG